MELFLRRRASIRASVIQPPEPLDASATRIVVLGDSIAHAPDLPAEQAWPALLEKHLQDAYPDRRWQVINASVSGSTTADAYVRFEQHVRIFRPDLVLIALGLNDCRQVYRAIDERRIASFYRSETFGFRKSYLYRAVINRLAPLPVANYTVDRAAKGPRVSPDTFSALLTWFVDASRQLPAQPALVSLTPVNETFDPSRRREFARWSEYNTQVGQIADTLQVPLIDVSQPFPDTQCWADDGIHLSATGEIEVAQRVWTSLQQSSTIIN
jgi:lysophospholipase L1-like esterase